MRNSGPPGCCRKYRDEEVTFFSRGHKTTLKKLKNVDFDTTGTWDESMGKPMLSSHVQAK